MPWRIKKRYVTDTFRRVLREHHLQSFSPSDHRILGNTKPTAAPGNYVGGGTGEEDGREQRNLGRPRATVDFQAEFERSDTVLSNVDHVP